MWTLVWSLAAVAAPCDGEVVLARSLLPGGDSARISLSELTLSAASLNLDVRYGRDRQRRPVVKQATLTAEYLVENGRDEVAWTLGVTQDAGAVGVDVAGIPATQLESIDVDRLQPTWSSCEGGSTAVGGVSWLQELPAGPSRVVVHYRLEAENACRLRLIIDERWPAEAVQLRLTEAGPMRGTLTLPARATASGEVYSFAGAGDVLLELPGC